MFQYQSSKKKFAASITSDAKSFGNLCHEAGLVLHHHFEVVQFEVHVLVKRQVFVVFIVVDIIVGHVVAVRIGMVCRTGNLTELVQLTTHNSNRSGGLDTEFHASSFGTHHSDHNVLANLDGIVSFPRQDQHGFLPFGCQFDHSLRRRRPVGREAGRTQLTAECTRRARTNVSIPVFI